MAIQYGIDDKTGERIAYTDESGGWKRVKPKGKSAIEVSRDYKKQLAEETGTLESMLIGAGKNTNDLIEGIKSLVQGDDYKGDPYAPGEDYAALKEAHPVATTAGEIASEIGQIALPAGAAMKASKIAKSAPLLTDAAAATSLAGLRRPGEEQTRAGNMQTEALMSMLGGTAGKFLSKLSTGSSLVPGAREMMDRGVDLTPAQASEGAMARGGERVARLMPVISKSMDVWENNAKKMWHKDIISEAAIDPSKVTEHGRKGLQQVKEQFSEAYKDAWSGVTIKDVDHGTINKLLTEGSAGLTSDSAAALKSIAKTVKGKLKAAKKADSSIRGAHYDAIDKTLNSYIVKANSQGRDALATELQGALGTLRANLPDNVRTKLAAVDELYPKFLTLDDAAAAAKGDIGNFSPGQAIEASASTGGRDAWRKGEAPLQSKIEAGLRTVGRQDQADTPGFIRLMSKDFPGAPTDFTRFLMNPTIGKSKTQKIFRDLAKARKKTGIDEIITSGRVGAAASGDDQDWSMFKSTKELEDFIMSL